MTSSAQLVRPDMEGTDIKDRLQSPVDQSPHTQHRQGDGGSEGERVSKAPGVVVEAEDTAGYTIHKTKGTRKLERKGSSTAQLPTPQEHGSTGTGIAVQHQLHPVVATGRDLNERTGPAVSEASDNHSTTEMHPLVAQVPGSLTETASASIGDNLLHVGSGYYEALLDESDSGDDDDDGKDSRGTESTPDFPMDVDGEHEQLLEMAPPADGTGAVDEGPTLSASKDAQKQPEMKRHRARV